MPLGNAVISMFDDGAWIDHPGSLARVITFACNLVGLTCALSRAQRRHVITGSKCDGSSAVWVLAARFFAF